MDKIIEPKPYFHEWATVLPGMICLSRKARNATFRNYVAAETATPVIGCAAGLKASDAKNFYFAGVCRSKTVRPIDDGTGPSVDEFFTLHIGGMVVRGAARCRPAAQRSHARTLHAQTMLNNSAEPVFPGDMLEWTLTSEKAVAGDAANNNFTRKRMKTGPRRVGIKVASPTSERVIGRCAPPLRARSSPPRADPFAARFRPRCLTFAKPVRRGPLSLPLRLVPPFRLARRWRPSTCAIITL